MWLIHEVNDQRQWVLARDALKLLAPLYKHKPSAEHALTHFAEGALVATRCRKMRIDEEDDDSDPVEREDQLVAPFFWQVFEKSTNGRLPHDWAAGTFGFKQRPHGLGWRRVQLWGVEFCEDDIRREFNLPARSLAVFPMGALQTIADATNGPPSALNRSRRGPKPKTFWGDAMAATEASISSGELLASSQADVERAMLDWIIRQGFDAGESTIRNYAKPVWDRVTRGQ
jgi:hypothetical protein